MRVPRLGFGGLEVAAALLSDLTSSTLLGPAVALSGSFGPWDQIAAPAAIVLLWIEMLHLASPCPKEGSAAPGR